MVEQAGDRRVAEIIPYGTLDLEFMSDLHFLNESLLKADLSTDALTAVIPGVKDGGLAAGISIASLALSSISTLVTVLGYFSSRKPKYKITVDAGDVAMDISGLDKNSAFEAIDALQGSEAAGAVLVRIGKG